MNQPDDISSEDFTVTENSDARRFELVRNDQVVGFASYSEVGDTVVVPHVETFSEHRGQGYAGRLMDGLLDLLRQSDRKITPLCPFAAAHMRSHPDQQDLLA